MSDTRPAGEHLSDDEIDLYSAGLLTDERVRPFEEHYLDCPECLRRVDRVEALVTGLRALPERRPVRLGAVVGAAAAGLAGLALGWHLHTLRRPVAPEPPRAADVRVAPSGDIGTGAAWVRFDLEPGVRHAARAQTIRLPATATHVLLAIDSREAGTPGSAFDVSLTDSEGRALTVVLGVPSAADGFVSLVVPAAILKPGEYLVEARQPPAVLEIPFRVELPVARP